MMRTSHIDGDDVTDMCANRNCTRPPFKLTRFCWQCHEANEQADELANLEHRETMNIDREADEMRSQK